MESEENSSHKDVDKNGSENIHGIPKDLLRRRTHEYAQKEKRIEVRGTLKEFTVFRLKKEWYLIEMDFIDEIIKPSRISRFPRQRDFMLGAMNVRGNVILNIDLGILLTIGPVPMTETSKIIIIKTGNDTTGFFVEETSETIYLDTADIQEKIATLKGSSAEFVKGLYQKDSRHLIWLDAEKITAEIGNRLLRHA